jgi:Kef-type K+ transport system membrane component KefB
LYLPELRDLFKSIFLSVGAISVLTFSLVTLGVRLLIGAGVATFTKDLGLSSGCMTGIAMLVGAIMTARSPASAIAIVKELRAKGPFTRCFLGVTVVSDVVVLVLFAISVAFARGQCTGNGFSGGTILCSFVCLVANSL